MAPPEASGRPKLCLWRVGGPDSRGAREARRVTGALSSPKVSTPLEDQLRVRLAKLAVARDGVQGAEAER